jgi:alpha-tubulin suppressor-like RCC1 family protein
MHNLSAKKESKTMPNQILRGIYVLATGLTLAVSASGLTVSNMAAGGYHTLIVKSDGSLWACGRNEEDQLGWDSSYQNASIPTRLAGISNVAAVAGGTYHSLALLADGTLRAWGQNNRGQVGNGATNDPIAPPAQVVGLSNLLAASGGYDHSLALKADGTVWGWGDNTRGELGLGAYDTNTGYYIPFQTNLAQTIPGLTSIVAIAAGDGFSLAVKTDRTLWVWGANWNGQLGDGTNLSTNVPHLSALSNIAAVSAGRYFAMALKTDGTVWTWGANGSGQLGNGQTNLTSLVPVQVVNLSNVAAIAAGDYYALAAKTDGTVWAWGDNRCSQLGQITAASTNAPVQIAGLSNIVALSAAWGHCLALDAAGVLRAWGNGMYGQLGNGVMAFRTLPHQVGGLSNISLLAAGADFSMAAVSNGAVWAWGNNKQGQLGNGNNVASNAPGLVSGLSNVSALAGGGNWYYPPYSKAHALGLKDGSVWAWGNNDRGQLGNGTNANTNLPIAVGLANVTALGAGKYFSLTLKSGGTVWGWGENDMGQLGIANQDSTNRPVQALIADVTAIACGSYHVLALKTDRSLQAWGNNWSGQLGNGMLDNTNIPVAVIGTSDTLAIAAGGMSSMKLKADGTVWAWGNNYDGLLGVGSTNPEIAMPAQVLDLFNITTIAAGDSHMLALASNGTVWAWGNNFGGQLGIGQSGNLTNHPVQVLGLSNVTAIAAGANHSLALKNDGTVWAWGYNDYGQLGDGVWWYQSDPTQVVEVGSLSITLAPTNGAWRMTAAPAAYSGPTNGIGNLPATIAPAGEYAIHFGRLPGYQTPLPQTNLVVADTLTNVSAVYVPYRHYAYGDYDGDRFTDPGVYGPTSGIWLVRLSQSAYGTGRAELGGTGWLTVSADYDGDRKTDPAIYNRDSGQWTAMLSAFNYLSVSAMLGGAGFMPVVADYDADGLADPAVYQIATGQWIVMLSANNYGTATATLGGPDCHPIPADFDADAKADPAVFDAATCTWYVMLSAMNYFTGSLQFGTPGFIPIPGDYDLDGKADLALYQESSGQWQVKMSGSDYALATATFGGVGYAAAPGDFDADRKADPAVYRDSDGEWLAMLSSFGYLVVRINLGGPDWTPVQ